ncbi:DUF3500 domain-containing protein [Pseudonocardia eucalypti]|uniref:DUF3500 domain-containing protein n=2 Tax=Pseudonocardia eucalypti TaxID=648755 RepID=A0ABP9PR68_9PSEU
MAEAAEGMLASVDGAAHRLLAWPFGPAESSDPEVERRRWFYTPTDHGGLPVGEMTPVQYQRAMALLATGLSEAGYGTVSTIMGLENVLDRTEGFAGTFAGRDRGRDPGRYYLRIFGRPGDRTWGWRFGGHHVSVNSLVVDGELVAATPCFLGADPACSPLLGRAELRPLGGVEGLARELARSLGPEAFGTALLSANPPIDISGGNRSRVSPGDRSIPLPHLFRGRLAEPHHSRMAGAHDAGERAYGLTEGHRDELALPATPRGLPASAMSAGQRELLRTLLDCYLGRAPSALAERLGARYADAGLDGVHFAWAGSVEPGEGCYYRLHGPRLLVEYDNTQRAANHAHSVWRDPEGDFGADVLADHLGFGRG